FARAAFALIAVERAGAVIPNQSFEMSRADSAELINAAIQQLSGSPEQLGNLLPRYVDLRCAPDGTLWLRPLDLERGGLGGGRLWLRIASNGSVREVRFPERFDPMRFTDEMIWGVQRNDLDVPSVAWLTAPRGD